MKTLKQSRLPELMTFLSLLAALCLNLLPALAHAQSAVMSDPAALRGNMTPATIASYANASEIKTLIQALPSLKESDFKDPEMIAKLTPVFTLHQRIEELDLEQTANLLKKLAHTEALELIKKTYSFEHSDSLETAKKLHVLATLRSIYLTKNDLENISNAYLNAYLKLSNAETEQLKQANNRAQTLLKQDVATLISHLNNGDSINAAPVLAARPSRKKDISLLSAAQNKLYQTSGGSRDNGQVDLAKVTTRQRTDFFRSKEFRDWVSSERAQGKHVFWLRDMDKTQSAGDVFTFFFKWRADKEKFTPAQNEILKTFLKTVQVNDQKFKAKVSQVDQNDASANANLIIELWRSKEAGGEGITLLQFWLDIYWPTQHGLTRSEKLEQAAQFAPYFAPKIYPGVREENLALRRAGVEVVLVSMGDQEVAQAVAPLLGIKPANAAGAFLKYDEHDVASGLDVDSLLHTYERFDKESATKPQNGKPLLFHYWLQANRHRFGWKNLNFDKVVIAAADGDSASTDGGMMMPLYDWPIGNFMIDTPHEPGRIQKFYAMAKKYRSGRFFTLTRDPSSPAAWEGDAVELAPYSSGKPLHLSAIPTRIAYSALNKVADWTQGHTTVFVGRKRDKKADSAPYVPEEFLQDLKNHVEKTLAALRRHGLLGYIVYATEDTEFAIMNWTSEPAMTQAFQTEKGKAVAADAGRIFEPQPMVWEKLEKFTGVLMKNILEGYLSKVRP